MNLHEDWHFILRRSWSVRWTVLAGLLSGAEVVVPLLVDVMPRNVFAVLSFFSVAGAVVARILVQPKDGL